MNQQFHSWVYAFEKPVHMCTRWQAREHSEQLCSQFLQNRKQLKHLTTVQWITPKLWKMVGVLEKVLKGASEMQTKAFWGRNTPSSHFSHPCTIYQSAIKGWSQKELTHPYFHKTVSFSLTLYKYRHLYTGKLKVFCRSKWLKSHLLGILAFNKVRSVSSVFFWLVCESPCKFLKYIRSIYQTSSTTFQYAPCFTFHSHYALHLTVSTLSSQAVHERNMV